VAALRSLGGQLQGHDRTDITAARYAAVDLLEEFGVARGEAVALASAALQPAGRDGPGETAQGSALILVDPEPWPDPVEGQELFADIVATLKRYLVLPHRADVAVALWIALTYLVDQVDALPRLALTSPTRACGKSRTLAVIGALARRSLHASSVSASVVFRIIEAAHPTLLLDEMDNARLTENDELRAILNSGHERSQAWTLRNVGEQHEPRSFSTWAPVALACIGKLPDTVASRCVRVPMRRRAPAERVERLRGSQIGRELEPLRRRLLRWSRDHAEAVRSANPLLPDRLGDRDGDNWSPLLAIATEVGGNWVNRAYDAALALCGAEQDEAPGILLLQDLRALFDGRNTDRLSTEEILQALRAMETRPWSEWRAGRPLSERGLAKLLKAFDIEPGSVRFGRETRKGYVADAFTEAWRRYLLPYSAHPARPVNYAAFATHSDPAREAAVPDGRPAPDPQVARPVPDVPDRSPRDVQDMTRESLPAQNRSSADQADSIGGAGRSLPDSGLFGAVVETDYLEDRP
jgi:putative DNA primase/helicase